jgi:high-affinity Fe2+/Pb2+ permease
MLSSKLRILLLSLTLFLLGALLIFLAVERGSHRLLMMGVGALTISAGGFSVGLWRVRRRRTPLERRREQKLWKSGPLGRKWLEGRRRIP